MNHFKTLLAGGCVISLAGLPALGAVSPIKNVILMISDGAGYNTHQATNYYTGTAEPYDNSSFIKVPFSTYNLRSGAGALDTNAQDQSLVYNTNKAWDDTPVAGQASYNPSYAANFAGYEWLKNTAPDSAGTMSALMTGKKVYRGGINVDGYGNSLVTAAQAAKANGKMVGTISTVRYNHATVAAGGGAHNISRNNYLEISYEMFGSGVVDVIGGAGHPEFDDNNQPVDVGGVISNLATGNRFDAPLWNALRTESGSVTKTRAFDGKNFTVNGTDWDLKTSRQEIENLANGVNTVDAGKRLAMIPRAYSTFQYKRDGDGTLIGDPKNSDMPTLTDMTRASLNHMGTNEQGFFLSIEGGAVDWAMHGNDLGRMVEEHIDFNDAVESVIQYLDAGTAGNDWSNTLLIVTADHDHVLYGPDSDTIAFEDLKDQGAGNLPEYKWQHSSHGNQLVPGWLRGANAKAILSKGVGSDQVHGVYSDQALLGDLVMRSVPEPSSIYLLGLGMICLKRRGRKA